MLFFCESLPVTGVKLEKACRPCRRNRRGAAVVEFAIVAPLFFLMIFGMIEFGRAIMVQADFHERFARREHEWPFWTRRPQPQAR